MLKLIKEDLKEEKEKFKERVQGVEVSLFIENIYSIDHLETKATSDPDELASIVKNVIEKKNLIEKLQEKMSERLGVINNLLANHAVSNAPQAEPKAETLQTPNIVKNSIKLINLNLGQTKYHYNFYNKPINEGQYEWSKAFRKNSQYKVKKNLTRTRQNFKGKRGTSDAAITNRHAAYSGMKLKDLNPHRSVEGKDSHLRNRSETLQMNTNQTREGPRKVKLKSRKSIDGFKGLVNQFFEPNEENEDGKTH